jgi:hypothetical protein
VLGLHLLAWERRELVLHLLVLVRRVPLVLRLRVWVRRELVLRLLALVRRALVLHLLVWERLD